jgi:hypothetical protein
MADFAKVMRRMIDDLLDFTRARLGGGMPIFPGSRCHEKFS